MLVRARAVPALRRRAVFVPAQPAAAVPGAVMPVRAQVVLRMLVPASPVRAVLDPEPLLTLAGRAWCVLTVRVPALHVAGRPATPGAGSAPSGQVQPTAGRHRTAGRGPALWSCALPRHVLRSDALSFRAVPCPAVPWRVLPLSALRRWWHRPVPRWRHAPERSPRPVGSGPEPMWLRRPVRARHHRAGPSRRWWRLPGPDPDRPASWRRTRSPRVRHRRTCAARCPVPRWPAWRSGPRSRAPGSCRSSPVRLPNHPTAASAPSAAVAE